jgi:hypothetical protein
MGITAVIIEGIVAISLFGIIGDVVSKIARARIKAKAEAGAVHPRELEALEGKVALLEARLEEREDAVRKLQDEVRFVSRMLEDKTGGRT